MVVYYRNIGDLRVVAEFTDQTLKLTVLDKNTAWGATLGKEEMSECYKSQKVTFEDYYSSLQKYFQPLNQEFEFKEGEFTIQILLKHKIKMVFFHAKLQQLNFTETVYGKLDEFNRNTSELSRVKAEYSELQKEHHTLKVTMDDFLTRKQNQELEMYNKFLGILNEKKSEIQHLKELLTSFRSGRSTLNLTSSNKNHRVTSPQPSTSKCESPVSNHSDEVLIEEKPDQSFINFDTQELLNEL